jgi:hypothetical protein
MIRPINNSEVYFESMVPEYFIQGATSVPVIRPITNTKIVSYNYAIISTVNDFNLNIERIIFGEYFFDIRFEHLISIESNLELIKHLILNYLKKNFIHGMKIVFVYQPSYHNGHYGVGIDSKIYFDNDNNQYIDRPSLLVHENYDFKVGMITSIYFKYTDWLFENSHDLSVLKLVNDESAFLFFDIIPSCLLLVHNNILYFLDRKQIFYSMDAFFFESYTNIDKSLLHRMQFTQNEIDLIKIILY